MSKPIRTDYVLEAPDHKPAHRCNSPTECVGMSFLRILTILLAKIYQVWIWKNKRFFLLAPIGFKDVLFCTPLQNATQHLMYFEKARSHL